MYWIRSIIHIIVSEIPLYLVWLACAGYGAMMMKKFRQPAVFVIGVCAAELVLISILTVLQVAIPQLFMRTGSYELLSWIMSALGFFRSALIGAGFGALAFAAFVGRHEELPA